MRWPILRISVNTLNEVQMKDHKTIADDFWRSRREYPPYDHVEARHNEDKNNIDREIRRYLNGQNSLSFCEIGCGKGEMVEHFWRNYNISRGYAYDLNPTWIQELTARGFPNWLFEESDISRRSAPFPETDVCISNGVFIYIFDDQDVTAVLSKIRSKLVLLRLPCSLEPEDTWINKKSEQLKSQYAARYRKPSTFLSLGENAGLQLLKVARAWPDEIESQFGTRQFLFVFGRLCDPLCLSAI
jgi:SAM-dependent methyltransferase